MPYLNAITDEGLHIEYGEDEIAACAARLGLDCTGWTAVATTQKDGEFITAYFSESSSPYAVHAYYEPLHRIGNQWKRNDRKKKGGVSL